jgi:hypothetical protein
MEAYLRQQFDLLVHEATGNFVERIVHRCGGSADALDRLRHDPDADGVWVSEYVETLFAENLLDSTSGACFVLEALERRSIPADPGGSTAEVLARLARAAFAALLAQQAAQLLQRSLVFET